jgi:hypothetical protein
MIIVRKDQVTITSPIEFHAEASTLGLAPGEWPDLIAVLNDDNEGFLFVRGGSLQGWDGEFSGFMYHSNSTGRKLTVFND